jgi:hypothetical protein
MSLTVDQADRVNVFAFLGYERSQAVENVLNANVCNAPLLRPLPYLIRCHRSLNSVDTAFGWSAKTLRQGAAFG